MHPVQIHDLRDAQLPAVVTERAFEVYDAIWPGRTLDDINTRGGLGVREVVAFLYARSFPREEWRKRFDEALARA
jgi:hypothetical protein